MDRYAIALGKFPSFADVYEAVFGYREPWEYQTGRRYNSRQIWFNFDGFRKGVMASIQILSEPNPRYHTHWVQTDALEVLPIDQPNRNGQVYQEESFFHSLQQQAIVSNRPIIVHTQIPPLRGQNHWVTMLDDYSWRDTLGSALQYSSSVTIRLKRGEPGTNITGGVIGVFDPNLTPQNKKGAKLLWPTIMKRR